VQALGCVLQRSRELRADPDAVLGEFDRRRHRLGEADRAVALQSEREASDRAGHADRKPALERLFGIGVACLVQEHVARRAAAGLLAVVDRNRIAGRGRVHQHEAAAAEIAGARQRHREREGDGDCGIDRIAAVLENLDADPGRVRLLACDHPVLRGHRVDDRALAVAGGAGLGKRRDEGPYEDGQALEHSSMH
jgi:hypothetical protein